MNVNPNFAKSYYNRAAIRNELGDEQGAIRCFFTSQ
ncbi:tetratricopeptide repeat protein [Cylindrospermopsis raciborskii]|nr:tetratricopeptide repeat protein [Cylindrospermopsis raciborskii]